MVVLSTWRRLGFIDCLFVPRLTRDNISKKRYHETTTHRYVWWMCGSRKQIKQEEKVTVAEEHSHQIKNSRTSMPQGSPLSPLFPSHRFDILLNTLLLLNKNERIKKKEISQTKMKEKGKTYAIHIQYIVSQYSNIVHAVNTFLFTSTCSLLQKVIFIT